MAKYFKHDYGITVSEFQMICICLNRNCDYQVALKTVRDELSARKEKGRYWLATKEDVWEYFYINFDRRLNDLGIESMDELIDRTKIIFEKG